MTALWDGEYSGVDGQSQVQPGTPVRYHEIPQEVVDEIVKITLPLWKLDVDSKLTVQFIGNDQVFDVREEFLKQFNTKHRGFAIAKTTIQNSPLRYWLDQRDMEDVQLSRAFKKKKHYGS